SDGRRRRGGRNSGSRTDGRFLSGARFDNFPTPAGRTVARSFQAIFFACRMTSASSCCSARSNPLLAMTLSALDHFKAANRCLGVGGFGAGETGHVGVLPRGIDPHGGLEKSRFLTRGPQRGG